MIKCSQHVVFLEAILLYLSSNTLSCYKSHSLILINLFSNDTTLATTPRSSLPITRVYSYHLKIATRGTKDDAFSFSQGDSIRV